MSAPDPPVVVTETAWTPTDVAGQRQALAALLFGHHPQIADDEQDAQPAA